MSEQLVIAHNGHERLALGWAQLTDKEREWFGYLDAQGQEDASFVRYRGSIYDLGQVETAPDVIKAKGFDGYVPEGFGFGVAFRYFDEHGDEREGVVVGRYYVTGGTS